MEDADEEISELARVGVRTATVNGLGVLPAVGVGAVALPSVSVVTDAFVFSSGNVDPEAADGEFY